MNLFLAVKEMQQDPSLELLIEGSDLWLNLADIKALDLNFTMAQLLTKSAKVRKPLSNLEKCIHEIFVACGHFDSETPIQIVKKYWPKDK